MDGKVKKLTHKEQAFVREYLIDLNGKEAALRACYAPGNAKVQACQMLQKPHIIKALAEAMQARIERTEIDQDWVIERLQSIVERCMQAEPVLVRADGEWVETGEYRFDAAGANKALELLGKHLNMWIERKEVKSEVTGKDGGPIETKSTLEAGPGVLGVLSALTRATSRRQDDSAEGDSA